MKVECYFKEKPPSVDWYRGAIPVKTDPRVVITYDETKMYACMEMKKCKITDEAKYRVQVEDADGEETLEFAGFSLFVKGTVLTLRYRLIQNCFRLFNENLYFIISVVAVCKRKIKRTNQIVGIEE